MIKLGDIVSFYHRGVTSFHVVIDCGTKNKVYSLDRIEERYSVAYYPELDGIYKTYHFANCNNLDSCDCFEKIELE